MKFFIQLLPLLVLCSIGVAADNLISDGTSGNWQLIDNANNRWNAHVAYTTDGSGDIYTLGGLSASADNVIGDALSGNHQLIDNNGARWGLSVWYTTDGAGNVIPISGGGGGGGVASVTASAPVLSSGGSHPNITITKSDATHNGYLASADWTTFNNKQDTLAAANGTTNGYLVSTDWSTFSGKIGGTGTVNTVPKFISPNTLSASSITDDGLNHVGINNTAYDSALHITAGHITQTGTTTINSPTITVADATGIVAGMWVSDSAGAFTNSNFSPVQIETMYRVVTVVGTSITLNQNAASTQAADTFTFSNPSLLIADYGNPTRGLFIGATDGFGRPTLNWAAPNSMLKLGQWNVDGDPYEIPSQGLVTYFNTINGTPLDNTNGSIQLFGQNILWFADMENGAYNTWMNIDPTSMYYADYNTGNVKFSVQSATGNTVIAGTVQIKGGSPAAGYVLTSDATGNATWQTGGGGGVTSVTGTAPVVSSGGTTPAISMHAADTSHDGYLSSADWTAFNGKQATLGFTPVANTETISTSSPLSGGGDLSANRTISITKADGSTNGYLASSDWTAFNSKAAVSRRTISLTNATVFLVAAGSQSDVNSISVVRNTDDIVISAIPSGVKVISICVNYTSMVNSSGSAYVYYPEPNGSTTLSAATLPAIMRFTSVGAWISSSTGASVAITNVSGTYMVQLGLPIAAGQFSQAAGGIAKIVP